MTDHGKFDPAPPIPESSPVASVIVRCKRWAIRCRRGGIAKQRRLSLTKLPVELDQAGSSPEFGPRSGRVRVRQLAKGIRVRSRGEAKSRRASDHTKSVI